MIQDVAIIGAGFAGVAMAIELKRAGIRAFTVFERAHDVGGVWRDNVYPGAGCDLPSHLYSYSFARSGEWTRTYARQPQILAYLKSCVRQYDIASHLQFDAEITHARFDSAARTWRLRTSSGEEHTARVLIAATGQFAHPRLPDLPGLDQFKGRAFHSAQWDDGHALDGRSVAVIGNGCSAVQIVPSIAPTVKQLYVFQRSPKWIIPKWDPEFGPIARWLFKHFAWPQQLSRAIWFLLAETVAYSPIHRGWMSQALTAVARLHLRHQVADAALRAKLTPDYPFGCNRMILSSEYYPALMRDNVELVTDGIARVVPDGIETSDGRVRRLDTIIHATGFQPTRFLVPLEIEGPGGSLSEAWRDGASAYLGMAIPGFPNLFIMYGPNTASTSNSIIYMLESQARYIRQCLELVREQGAIEVTAAAFGEYQRNMSAWLEGTVWNAQCRSWYKTESGKITNPWPLRAYRYRLATRRPDRATFAPFVPTQSPRGE
jgi:cation diffusion facilitator CzcD-associated flavoprotein CzcO